MKTSSVKNARPSPVPVNRIVTAPMVRVRALGSLSEVVSGEVQRFAPGAEFEISAVRARALGPLVEIVSLL